MLKHDTTPRLSRRFVATVAIAATCALSARPHAGNLTLTLTGFPAPIEISSFSVGATKVPPVTGGSSTLANFQDAAFTAAESPATPLEITKLIAGARLTTAQLVVLSPTTGQLVSDWTFEEALVTSVALGHLSGASASPMTDFSLSYNKVTYRVFATDGSVAQRSCWNVVSNVAC